MEGGSVSLRDGSEFFYDLFCELCNDDGRHVEAEGYCVDCREYLCGSCYGGHRKSRPTRHHALLDKDNMPKCKKIMDQGTYDPSNVTATKVKDILVKTADDTHKTETCIAGSAVISSDKLILADWSNAKVKLVDTHRNKVVAQLKVSCRPHDIAVINRHRVAVALPMCKEILLVEVKDVLTEDRVVHVSGECSGVSYTQNRLLVTFVDSPRLEILDLHGNVQRTIQYSRDDTPLFTRPEYVSVSHGGSNVYVTDETRHTVTCLTLDGEVKAVYEDEELKYPQSVCSDHHGNVYVCGWVSRNVHMLTAKCRRIKVPIALAEKPGSAVCSVSHCQDTDRLFIGLWESNNIYVYQLHNEAGTVAGNICSLQ